MDALTQEMSIRTINVLKDAASKKPALSRGIP